MFDHPTNSRLIKKVNFFKINSNDCIFSVRPVRNKVIVLFYFSLLFFQYSLIILFVIFLFLQGVCNIYRGISTGANFQGGISFKSC